MANTTIQIKSSTSNSAPIRLNVAEPAYSYVSNTLFIGTANNDGYIPIGGQFYVDQQSQIFAKTNAAFNTANSASDTWVRNQANAAFITANAAFIAANSASDSWVRNQANSAFIAANAAFLAANTPDYVANSAAIYANAAFNKANSANVLAQAAYDNSNTKFSSTGGFITGFANVSSNISVGTTIDFDPNPAGEATQKEGRIFYDKFSKAFGGYNDTTRYIHFGRDVGIRVFNNTGNTIGAAVPVVVKNEPASGGAPHIDLANAATAANAEVIGLTQTSIANGTYGMVISQGLIEYLDTTLYTVGQELFLSTTPGQITTTVPSPPNIPLNLGYIASVSALYGEIIVNIHLMEGKNKTTGSILFARNGLIDQDPETLYWDYANNRLGIATNTPQANLHVAGDGLFTGNVVISGNLSISNAQSIVTQTLDVGGNIIVLNANTSGTPTSNSEIRVNRGSFSNAYIKWDETQDHWFLYSGSGIPGHILDSEETIISWADYSSRTPYEQSTHPIGGNLANATNELATTANTVAYVAKDIALSGSSYANSAFLKANTPSYTANSAANYANAAFTTANNAFTSSNGTIAWATANSAASYANSAFLKANTPDYVANSAASYANSAFLVANSAFTSSNGTIVWNTANAAFLKANTPDYVANSAASYANSAFLAANTPSYTANSAASYANAAFTRANNSINANTGGTITGVTTINANLIVTGANVSLGNVGNVHIYGGNTGQVISTDTLGNLSFIDLPTTNTITNTASTITLTNGVYVSGSVTDTQVLNDGNSYQLTDGSGLAPAWIVTFGFTNVTKFNRIVSNIDYTAASGHTVYFQLYNYATSFSLVAGTVTTTAGANTVTVSSTTGMSVGQTIKFGTSVGGLTSGTPYYILSIPTPGQLTVGVGTSAASIVTLSSASVTSTVSIEVWDNFGSYSGASGYEQSAKEVLNYTSYISSGAVTARLFHSNQGNTGHTTKIDYFALEQSAQGGQGPRGANGATGATGATGNGVSSGGTSGQILIKNSATDYDTIWSTNFGYDTANSAASYANSAYSTANSAVANTVALQGVNLTQNTWISSNSVYSSSAYAKANGAVQTGFTTIVANGTSFTSATNTGIFTITANTANGIQILNPSANTIDFGLKLVGTAGTYGNSTYVPVFTTDQFGRVTSIVNTAITVTGGGGSSSGYLTNSIIYANTTGYLSNVSNLQFYSSNNFLYVNGLTNLNYTGLSGSQNTALAITGANTKGGIGYLDFLLANNQSAGVTNPNKYFRLDNAGQFQIINSAYNQNIFNLTDAGALTVPSFTLVSGGGGSITFADGTTQTTAAGGAATDQTARNLANSAGSYANSAFLKANTPDYVANSAASYANSAFLVANSAFTGSNGTIVWATANAAFLAANTPSYTANSAATYANGAFIRANNSINANTGGTITGDLSISGNLTVLGNTVTVSSQTLSSNDTLFILGVGNYTSDLLDMGFAAHYNAGTNAHSGLVRDSGTKEWYLFKGYTPEIGANNNIDINDASFAIDTLNSNVKSTVITVKGIDLLPYVNTVFLAANTPDYVANSAASYANAAFITANAAFTSSNGSIAWFTANSAGSYANSAFLKANTPDYVANSAASYANSAFATANSAFTGANGTIAWATANSAASYANAAFTTANSAFTSSNGTIAWSTANSSGSYANSAFLKANTPDYVANSAAIYANGAFNQANTDYTFVSVTPGTYGSSSLVPVITLTSNGRVSAITTAAVSGGTGGSTNSFGTIIVSGQPYVIANIANSPVTFVAGSGMNITTDGTANSITFNSTGGFSGGTIANQLIIANSNTAISTTTGALQVQGGVGVTGNVYSGSIYTDGLYYAANNLPIPIGGSGGLSSTQVYLQNIFYN